MSILKALVDLIVEEGPGTISIPQVAARADVSVRTVYHYFPSKEALFDGLTSSMSSLVDTTDGGVPPTPRSPSELVEAMPAAYRHLEANARMFRALSVSELGGRIESSRRPERLGRIDAALGPIRDRLDDGEYRRLRAIVGLIASFDGYDGLTGVWGLTRDEAAEAAAWALRTLTDRARRSGVAT
ncbi:MAG: TetR/AcrR family transcriptional regulator [Ilumatobacteraceae bacterium]